MLFYFKLGNNNIDSFTIICFVYTLVLVIIIFFILNQSFDNEKMKNKCYHTTCIINLLTGVKNVRRAKPGGQRLNAREGHVGGAMDGSPS